MLNGVIAGGRHSLLDTPFTVAEERAYIEALPERSFLHVAEIGRRRRRIPDGQSVEHLRDSRVRPRGDHGDLRGRGAQAERRGAALAAVSFAAALRLGYEKIFTDLRADNLDSLAYHLALGFTIVGAARGHARVAGRDVDVVFIERFLEG